jgi:hypothetical protein
MSTRGRGHSRSVTPKTSRTRRGHSPQRRGLGDGQLVVKKVAPAGPTNYPMLTKTSYNQWSLLMKIKLKARGLWNVIEPSDDEFQLDQMALNTICSAVPTEMVTTLATKDTAVEAWESIRTMQIGDDHMRKASTQRVRREYEMLDFRNGEGVEFAM